MGGFVEARRREPADDLVSVLIAAEVDGQRLTDEQILAETLLILIGGDETTRHTLSGGTAELTRHPDQWQALQDDPELLPGAVEEMLRWTSPIKNMCRTLTADTDFHGTALHAGEKILLLFESANFDETVFGDPDVFRIDRAPNNHVSFGFGTHFCLGNQLARLELTAMTRRVLARLPDLRLADGAELPLRPANFVSGLEAMPVEFTRPRRFPEPAGGLVLQGSRHDPHIGEFSRVMRGMHRMHEHGMAAVRTRLRLPAIRRDRQVATGRAPHDVRPADPVEQAEIDACGRGGAQDDDDRDGENFIDRHVRPPIDGGNSG